MVAQGGQRKGVVFIVSGYQQGGHRDRLHVTARPERPGTRSVEPTGRRFAGHEMCYRGWKFMLKIDNRSRRRISTLVPADFSPDVTSTRS